LPVNLPSCDAIGSEPTIPQACATVLATKTIVNGEPSDETLDTATINAAITACPVGQSVRLAVDSDKVAFVAGGIALKSGVSLWLDAGTTLFLSRDPKDSDQTPGSGKCGGNNTGTSSCKALINVASPASSGVYGTGTIDGRGGEVVTGGTSTWWALEDLDDGNLAAPRLIQVTGGTSFVLYDVTLKNAPKFHVVIDSTVGFQVWGITINTPANSPNTDGVDPSRTKNGVIAYTKISTGDDNIAIKGAGLVDGMVVAHNHFGRGHGMSIGSETNGGVRNVSVCDLSLDGTDNGLRIKSDSSRGGLVQGIAYSDVCIRNSRHPLVFDPYYSSSTGTLIPDFRDITVTNVHVLGMGGINTFRGWDAAHPLGITLSNVVYDVEPTTITASYANVVFGPQPVNIKPAGTSVSVTDQVTGSDAARNCDNAWVTF
jgi:polygalacturonase